MTLEEYIIFQRYDIKGYATDTEEDSKEMNQSEEEK